MSLEMADWKPLKKRTKRILIASILIVWAVFALGLIVTFVKVDWPDLLRNYIFPLANIVATPIVFYLGFMKGTSKTVETAYDKITEKAKESPTAKRLLKMFEQSEKLFGDDQAVEQITQFFKEARVLVTSPEAKAFFTNATATLKQFSAPTGEQPLPDFKMPALTTKKKKTAA